MREKQIPESMLPGLRKLAEKEMEVRASVSGGEDREIKVLQHVDARVTVVPSLKERRPYFVR